MEARVWGCRGSLAAPGADTVRYGGNTSCIEVRLDSGEVLVLDAGTGIRAAGAAMADDPPSEVHLLLTHLHMDHLQGLGFFRPLFDPNVHVHIWGPPSPVQPLADRIGSYMSPPLFPVRLGDVPCTLTYHDATDEPVTIGSATVHARNVAHQGPTVGYRIEEEDGSLAYIPDHEPSLGIDLTAQSPDWVSGHDLAKGVDVLFHDAQYGDHEYPAHVGWGHSAFEHVMQFAALCQVGRVVLFHHDPYHSDEELEALLVETHEQWDTDRDYVCLAHEGMTMRFGPTGVRID